MNHPLPEIAIVGRPNVGKSTLFNRMLGNRRSITHATPGVTRDPVAAIIRLAGRSVRLVDTGGVAIDDTDYLTQEVARRALVEAAGAQAILLVLDVTELTGEDRELIQQLRRYADRVLLVINKVDHARREAVAMADYQGFGFQPVLPVSAAHGLGMDELIAAIGARLGSVPEPAPAPVPAIVRPIRVAIIGRPNSGKSTLSNRLTGGEHALVDDRPGTTRDSIEVSFSYAGKDFIAIDTAGMRRRARVTESVEYYSVQRAVDATRGADVVMLLVDAREGLADQDKKIAGLAVDRGVGLVIVLNKWDALEHVENRLQAMTDRIRFVFPVLEFAPVRALSARTGFGVPQLMTTVTQIRRQLDVRVSTPDLNKALERWVGEYAQGGDTRNRVRYGTQLGGRPPRFAFFANRRRGLPPNYAGYLRNCIRRDFGLSMVPVGVEVRASER